MWLHVCSRLIMILVLLQPSRTILDSSRSNLSTVTEDIVLRTQNELVAKQIIPNVDYLIQLPHVNGSQFYLAQCHTQQHNLTMTSWMNGMPNKETGSSLGAINIQTTDQLYIRNNGITEFTAYCTYQVYHKHDPVPGGCNIEFNFPIDPNIHTWYDGFNLWMEFQYARGEGVVCEDQKSWAQLQYTVRLLNFEDGWDGSLATFKSQLAGYTATSDIDQKGRAILRHSRKDQGKPLILISSYPHQGVMLSVIVTDKVTYNKAAYVTAVTYACDIYNNGDLVSCKVPWYFYLMVSLLGILGLFLLFAGHHYFVSGIFINGFLSVYLIMYMVFSITSASVAGVLIGSLFIGLFGGIMWVSLWYLAGYPPLSLLLTGANTGFLLYAILMYTPLVNLSAFTDNSWVYWIIAAAVILLTMLPVVIWPKKVNIIFCAFHGSYAVSSALSLYIGASVHHIVVEPVRRAVIPGYYNSILSAPLLARDGYIVASWIALFIAGMGVQFYMGRKGPDFPESPRAKRRQHRTAELEDSERTLLQRGDDSDLRNIPQYGSVGG